MILRVAHPTADDPAKPKRPSGDGAGSARPVAPGTGAAGSQQMIRADDTIDFETLEVISLSGSFETSDEEKKTFVSAR